MAKPILSIGIIFKNEIRCLERCLKSLQPLRNAVPCELVMADTGSEDGSRAIAASYADILIDFPWINDFSAARNSLLDLCSGTWHLAIDADEWLDEDISQLVYFLRTPEIGKKFNACALIIRNYLQNDLQGDYSDFLGARMLRRSTGVHYEGAIHEHWNREVGTLYGLGNTILHHDGYINFEGEQGNAKRKRNMELLKTKLADEPQNLMLLLQCIESAVGYEQEQFVRCALDGERKKWNSWEQLGPPILRHAVNIANTRSLPEFNEWMEQAQTCFPDSLFTTIDINYTTFMRYAEKKEYKQAIPFGEAYLKAVTNYRTKHDHIADMAYSSLMSVSLFREEQVRILIADAYFFDKQFEKSQEVLISLDGGKISIPNIKNYTGILMNLHAQSKLNMCDTLLEFWNQLNSEALEKKDRDARKDALYAASTQAFPKEYRKAEAEKGFGHAYTLFLPLEGKCGVGDAAAILEATDIRRMEEVLARQEDYSRLPIHALSYALEQGVTFPLPNSKPFPIEEMDSLASRLSGNFESFLPYVLKKAETPPKDWQGLLWVRGLLMGALRKYPWSSEVQDTEQGMSLARAFAKVEEEFLPRCYCKEILREDALFVLPPLHRFGWYCAKAFAAMEAHDTVGYVRLLREGLESCPDVKDMVEFLADHTADFQKLLGATPELLALAEQMRALLQQFDPNDPAILVLKSSPQYQQVAYLIERDTIQSPLLRQIPQ